MSCSSRRLGLLVGWASSSMLGRLHLLDRALVGDGEREPVVSGNRPDERRLPSLSRGGEVDLDREKRASHDASPVFDDRMICSELGLRCRVGCSLSHSSEYTVNLAVVLPTWVH